MKQTRLRTKSVGSNMSGSFFEGRTAPLITALEQNWEFKIHLLPRLKQEFPWVLSRPMTEGDFHHFCAEHGIEVVFGEHIPYGVYVRCDGEHFIFLNSELEGSMLVYVMAHELAHFLFHAPTRGNSEPEHFNHHVRAKNEFEAEIAATLLCDYSQPNILDP